MTSLYFSEGLAVEGDFEFQELLRLAANAESAAEEKAPPMGAAIDRWCELFNYTPDVASRLIIAQRNDVTRDRVSDEHWDLIKHRWEPLGYDKEAYEHAQSLEDIFQTQSVSLPPGLAVEGREGEEGDREEVFVFRLGGLLDTAEKVREVTGMDEVPRTVETTGEDGRSVKLCVVGGKQRVVIQDYLRGKRVGI